MQTKREYKIDIDPRILELLGPSLYTNIYYVLAELIANAYDADASNVYVIQKKDRIIVEDDGTGMSYERGDIAKYLNVAAETRSGKRDSYTVGKKRRKIGRKGVGKLAALSVSEDVLLMTKRGKEKSGFVLSRHVAEDHLLRALPPEKVVFEIVKGSGTSVVMTKPQYGLHKTSKAIKANLVKIFPLVDRHFKIHISTLNDKFTIDSFDKEMVQQLGALICLGNEFKHLAKFFDPGLALDQRIASRKQLLKTEDSIVENLKLKNKLGKTKRYKLEIKGWVGAYKSTKDRKLDSGDFPDNFLSLLANKKLGEYNILPVVGKNRLAEVYVVGQLHVDLFEETELPDIALSNRQGYKSDDERYQFVINYVRDTLLPQILDMRKAYGDFQRALIEKRKSEKQLNDEEELRRRVDAYRAKVSRRAASKIGVAMGGGQVARFRQIINSELNEALPLMGLKSKVDAQKKKLLICHAHKDKTLADVVYKMLLFNHIPATDIIYTSSDDESARIPEAVGIYEYLREFFVNSYSEEKILVLYITSDEMAKSWGAVTEVGAGWITRSNHKIFNLNKYQPKLPLNIAHEWQTSVRNGDKITMVSKEFDKFIVKIMDACKVLGFQPQSKQANAGELKRYLS